MTNHRSSPVTELADALERADWSGVSIGNKVMLKGAIDALRGVAQDAVRAAAERVCWFDWSDNDMDAVAAIDALRKAITSSVPSADQREGGK